MEWFSRTFGWGSYIAEQDRFAALFVSVGAPHGMMMFCTGKPAKTVIYVALDAKLAAAHFPQFSRAALPPRDAEFLVGHDEDGADFRWGGRKFTYKTDSNGWQRLSHLDPGWKTELAGSQAAPIDGHS